MQKIFVLSLLTAALVGCGSSGGGGGGGVGGMLGGLGSSTSSSTDLKVGAAADAFKAVTVSDDELKSVTKQLRAHEDKETKVAGPNSKYGKRLARLTAPLLNEDGLKLDFKVYDEKQVNANALPDGSIRVYSGLMDMMTDDELRGVIGHEIGHVKLGHSMSAMRTAYMASAGRKAAASTSGVGGALAASQLGGLGEALLNNQFSQSQETQADDYGLALMKKHGYNTKAMETAFRKIASLGDGKSKGALDSMMSSHPDAGKRADRMREMASK